MPICDMGGVIPCRHMHVRNTKHIMFTVFNGNFLRVTVFDILYVLFVCSS